MMKPDFYQILFRRDKFSAGEGQELVCLYVTGDFSFSDLKSVLRARYPNCYLCINQLSYKEALYKHLEKLEVENGMA